MVKACVYWLHLPEHSNMFSEGYIGVSIDPSSRFRQHIYSSKNGWHENLHLKRVFEKYNYSICQTIILEGSEKYCYEIEQKMRPKRQIGWNIAEGGGMPPTDTWTEERKKEKSEEWKKQYANGERQPYHHKWTDEQKKKNSEILKESYSSGKVIPYVRTDEIRKNLSEKTKKAYENGKLTPEMTDVTKKKLSKSQIERWKKFKIDGRKVKRGPHEESTKLLMSEKRKNMVWIKNQRTFECKTIQKENLQEWLDDGWTRGRIIKEYKFTEEERKRRSNRAKQNNKIRKIKKENTK